MLTRSALVLGVACLCVLDAIGLHAGEAEWKVGMAQVKITPEWPVMLAGYASRKEPFEKVADELYAKALVIEDHQGQRAVLVTSDIIGFAAAVAEPICERIKAKTGLERAQLLLNSAHTHTGPALSLEARTEGGRAAGDAQRTVEYTRQLQDRVVDVVVKATARLEPARLSWGTGVVHFVMNRRQFTPDGVILGANPRGLADRSVPVLRVDGTDGRPRAIVFGAAVHNTTLRPQHNFISGDYAGYAQAFVQQRHPSAQAMFTLGCAGDADPYPHSSLELAREHGAALGKEVCRVLEMKLQPLRGPLRVAFERVALPLQSSLTRAELEKQAAGKRGVQPGIARQLLKVLDGGGRLQDHYDCPVAVWQFGSDLTLVGLSGEVVVDYVPLLEKALGPLRLWITAYNNDVFGYLPSARVLAEGGYETRGLYSGGLGYFDARAQDVLVDKVRALSKGVGRDVP